MMVKQRDVLSQEEVKEDAMRFILQATQGVLRENRSENQEKRNHMAEAS